MYPQHEWKEKEGQFLRKNYQKMSNKQLSDILGVTKLSIQCKLHRLKLKRNIWDKQKIINQIFTLYNQGEKLNHNNMEKKYPRLLASAVRWFGSWKKAITSAGFDYNIISKNINWSDKKVVKEIQRLHKEEKKLNPYNIEKNYPELIGAAYRYFGNWKSAIEAAGIYYEKILSTKPRGYWSKKMILQQISELYKNNKPLNARYVNRHRSSLFDAANRHFGTWENTIIFAGLNYNEIRRTERWDRQKLIDKILELHKTEQKLNFINITNNHYDYLVQAAYKLFGSWENAITAAGLKYDEIRMDKDTETRRGRLFQRYLRNIFQILGKEVFTQKRFKFNGKTLIPDFVDRETGMWIDAKLRRESYSVKKTISKYLKCVDKITIYYLIGKQPKQERHNVIFKCVKDFYPQLREIGRNDIIENLVLLEQGIPTPDTINVEQCLKLEEVKT